MHGSSDDFEYIAVGVVETMPNHPHVARDRAAPPAPAHFDGRFQRGVEITNARRLRCPRVTLTIKQTKVVTGTPVAVIRAGSP
jgi:hypothetical protein